jgi:hypothetical protein
MSLAVGFALFVVGFAMLMAGIGLLIGGEIAFKSGKKITKQVGRKSAFAFLSFFPVFAVVNFALGKIDPNHVVPIAAVSWPLAVGCLGLGCTWLLRGMAANKPQPSYTLVPLENVADGDAADSSEPIVLELDVPQESAPPPAADKPARAKPRGREPFDFS